MTATRRAGSSLLHPLLDHLGALAIVVALVALLAAAPAGATPVSAKKARLQELRAKLEKVYTRADSAVERYNRAKSDLAAVRGQITENRHLLEVAEYNLQLAEEQLRDRAATVYKTRDTELMDVVFASGSFDDLVTQLDLMERLTSSDVDLVTSIAAYRQDVKDRRMALEAQEKTAARLVASTRESKKEILAVEARLEDMTAGLEDEIARLEDQAAARSRAAAEIADPGGSGHSAVVPIAQAQLGKPYHYGYAGPDEFDCSGLVMYCYARIGILLCHAATGQYAQCTPVPLSALQPGDLVFFGDASWCHHVGIYVGGGQMINAPHTGAVVSYASISGAFAGGRP